MLRERTKVGETRELDSVTSRQLCCEMEGRSMKLDGRVETLRGWNLAAPDWIFAFHGCANR